MKLSDVSDRNPAGGPRSACGGTRGDWLNCPDDERDALIDAIKSSVMYAGMVITLDGAWEPSEGLAALSEVIRECELLPSFTAYCIVRSEVTTTETDHDGIPSLVCRMFFKVVGASPAEFPRLLLTAPVSGHVQLTNDSLDAQRDFVAHIDDFCDGATCIAVANENGLIRLWTAL